MSGFQTTTNQNNTAMLVDGGSLTADNSGPVSVNWEVVNF